MGLFESPEEYLLCFNALCVDIAGEDHSLSEADFLNMMDDHDLTAKASMQPFYSGIAQKLQAQLDGGEEVTDASKAEEEAAQAEAAALERKKTQ